MKKLYQFLGTLPMAVILITALALALGFGTFCEAKYGTPAAQHYFYRALWFQLLLFLLSATLVVSALHRLPWERRHIGFVTTHLGIIIILVGNLIGIRLGREGQLWIPEGESADTLQLSRDVLWVQPENPGTPSVFPLDFNARPWAHQVHRNFSILAEGKPMQLTIDRYLPNVRVEEKVVAGEEEFPAIRLSFSMPPDQNDEVWLFSRDPERFGFRWGEAHLLFFELRSDEEFLALEAKDQRPKTKDKGILRLEFKEPKGVREIPVEEFLGKSIALEGTPYTLSLKDYFPDFIITEEGPRSRSEEPRNPALSFVLEGPEGKEAFLVFALHPEFEERHGVKRAISVKAIYDMETSIPTLPPALVGIVRSPSAFRVVMTSPDGSERKIVPFSLGKTYTHPWLDLSFRVLELLPKAKLHQEFQLKDNDVRQQAIHVTLKREGFRKEEWLSHGGVAHVAVGDEMVVLAYQPEKFQLPFSVRLIDFRKKEYPGTVVPSDFESDVEIKDPSRGFRFLRTISMNRPLTYRGYTLFQSSFVENPVETTVLSVRNDPGTPVVYGGFIIVVVGISLMFYLKTNGPSQRMKGKHG